MCMFPGGTMRVPSPSDRIYACARQFTMNLRYAFLIIARMRTYVLSTQLGVLRDQLRILSVRKCADFHENRLIYAYLSTRVYIDKVASPWQATRNSYTRSFSAIPASLPLILEEQIVSTAHYFSDRILFSKGMCTLISEPISDIPLYHWAQAIFL